MGKVGEIVYEVQKGLQKTIEYPYAVQAYKHMLDYSAERPLDINIETTTICPMKCKFCCNRIYSRERTIMSNELFEKIVMEYIDEMGGGTIGIGSMQSDFFSDPLLLDRMKIIEKNKGKLWVHSATPLICASKFSDKELTYILSCFDRIGVSVEGFDRDSYKKMCSIDGFDILVEQLRRVRRLISENCLNTVVSVAFRTYDIHALVSSQIYKELSENFIVDNVLDSFFSWFGTIKEEDLPEGARIHFSDNSEKVKDCVVSQATLAIQADGNVVGCGCVDWLEKYTIGSVNEDSLLNIWKSKKANEFRTVFSKKIIETPQICEECGLYTPVSVWKCKKYLDYSSMDGLYYLL